jgi:hypothetical protein
MYTFDNFARIAYSGFETAMATQAGDFDGNEVVDNADMARWRAGLGLASGARPADGDADADGDVDGADFLILQQQMGARLHVGSALLAVQPTLAAESAPVSSAKEQISDRVFPRGLFPVVAYADDPSATAARDRAFSRELGPRRRPVRAAFDPPSFERTLTDLAPQGDFRPGVFRDVVQPRERGITDAGDSPSSLSPQAVDATLAWHVPVEAVASRPLFRPR